MACFYTGHVKRYYGPRTGRFSQEDTVTGILNQMHNGQQILDPLSLNRYTYAHNNPILYGDASGNFAILVSFLVGAAVGAIVGAASGYVSATISGGDVGEAMLGGAIVGGFIGATGGTVGAVAVSLGGSVGATAAITSASTGIAGMVGGGANAAYQSYYNTGYVDPNSVLTGMAVTGATAMTGGAIGGAVAASTASISSSLVVGATMGAVVQSQTDMLGAAASAIVDSASKVSTPKKSTPTIAPNVKIPVVTPAKNSTPTASNNVKIPSAQGAKAPSLPPALQWALDMHKLMDSLFPFSSKNSYNPNAGR